MEENEQRLDIIPQLANEQRGAEWSLNFVETIREK
jgi:hypothetical protein